MKIKKLRTAFLIVILLTIGTVVAVFIGYRKVANAPEMLMSSIKNGADLSLGKIRQTATRDGRKEWSLEAGSADYMQNEKKAVLKDLAITYFLEDNREVYLNADQGILNTETNDIEFSGNVVIRNEDYRLATQRLNYEHERRFIFTDDPVTISGDAAEVSADSATFDLNTDKIVLTGKVKAAISRNFAPVQKLSQP